MSDRSLPDILSELDFLRDSAPEWRTELATAARLVDVAADAVVFRQGDPGNAVYLVAAGTIALEICAPAVGCRRLLTVGPGELLGWSAVLGSGPMTATARALGSATLVEIDPRQLAALCDRSPRFGQEFLRRTAQALAKRLTATRLQLLDIYGSEMPQG